MFNLGKSKILPKILKDPVRTINKLMYEYSIIKQFLFVRVGYSSTVQQVSKSIFRIILYLYTRWVVVATMKPIFMMIDEPQNQFDIQLRWTSVIANITYIGASYDVLVIELKSRAETNSIITTIIALRLVLFVKLSFNLKIFRFILYMTFDI